MSITALEQVHQEMRRLAIAGSDLAAGDFRLNKLVPPLRKSAQKAPVFGKIADAVEAVLSSTHENSAAALLELSSLVTAVLYTQGKTSAEGELAPLETSELTLSTANTSARVLKPLIEALTSPGSGRLQLIEDAHRRGAFADLRLVRPALAALDDAFPEIADFVAKEVLPIYGRALLPELRASFDPKGKTPHGRRLVLMSRLDPEGSHATVLEALEEGSKEVKLAAMRCLAGRADAADLLLPQIKARAKDVRAAAYRAVAGIDRADVIVALEAAIRGKDIELVAPYVAGNPNLDLAGLMLDELRKQLAAALAAGPTKSRGKSPAADAVARLHTLVRGITGRTDAPLVEALLEALGQHAELARLADDAFESGELVVERIARALLLSEDAGARAAIVELGPEAPGYLTQAVFVATSLERGPAEAYDAFASTFIERPKGRTKAALAARARAEALAALLNRRARDVEHDAWYDGPGELPPMFREVELDLRWLDAAVKAEDRELILALAQPGHSELHRYLEDAVKAALGKKKFEASYDLGAVLRGLIVAEHPNVVALFVSVAERCAKKSTGHWTDYMIHLNVFVHIPDLPPAAIEPLKALIPKMPSKLLDGFAEPLDALIAKRGATP